MSRPWPEQTPGRVVLPDGRVVVGVAAGQVTDLDPPAEVVVALGRAVPPVTGERVTVPWPDFGLPRDPTATIAVLRAAYDAATGRRVAVSCRGGRGRTGTALAVLAVLGGVDPGEAVGWVRERYDARAVETPRQRRWVRRLEPSREPSRSDRRRPER